VRILAQVGRLFGVVLVAGCSPSAAPASGVAISSPSPAPGSIARSGLPPRPIALPLNGVEPCALLAGPGAAQLGIGPGSPHGSTSTGDAAQCQWSTLSAQPGNHWMARVLLHQGADTTFVSPSATPLTPVDGFTAVQVRWPSNPARECALYVDVAPQQSLLVTYSTDSAVGPGPAPTAPCEEAQHAAAVMVQRLRTLVHQQG
jgi:hypothetical protein